MGHKNVKFSLDQLEELKHIATCYLGMDGKPYIHAVRDFHDWINLQKDHVLLDGRVRTLSLEEKGSLILPPDPPCSLCGGDPSKVMGGCRCDECLIIGTQPWGG